MAFLDEIFIKTYYGNTVETWTYALLIILGAFIAGKVLYIIIGKVIKNFAAKTKTNLDYIIIDMIEEPIMFGIILFGTWFGLSTLTFSEGTTEIILKGYKILITINITWFIARLVNAMFENYVKPLTEKTDSDFDDQVFPILRKGIIVVIWVLGIIISLDNAGYKIGPILAGLGIGGLAFAFAAKDILANIFGGITIFTDKPFKIKDRIKVEGYDGTVEEIGLRSTRIRTLAGRQVTIPNSTFAENPVENITREPTRKITLKLGLTYDTTPEKLEKAQEILKNIALKNDLITDKHHLAFTDFGDFALGITFIYYIKKSSNIMEAQNSVNMAILKEYNKAKLGFAFPTQTIEVVK